MKTLTDKNVDFCWPSKSYFYWLNKNSRGHGIFRIMVEKETNICNENWWPHFTNISTRNGFLRIQSNTETWKEFKFRNKNTFLRNVTRDATLLFIDSPLNNLCVNIHLINRWIWLLYLTFYSNTPLWKLAFRQFVFIDLADDGNESYLLSTFWCKTETVLLRDIKVNFELNEIEILIFWKVDINSFIW